MRLEKKKVRGGKPRRAANASLTARFGLSWYVQMKHDVSHSSLIRPHYEVSVERLLLALNASEQSYMSYILPLFSSTEQDTPLGRRLLGLVSQSSVYLLLNTASHPVLLYKKAYWS